LPASITQKQHHATIREYLRNILLAVVFISVGAIIGFLKDYVFVSAFVGVLFFAFWFWRVADRMGEARRNVEPGPKP
jgi:hypothetical protein